MSNTDDDELTSQDYRAEIRSLGMTPVRPSYQGATIYVDRDGQHHSIPDADSLSPGRRRAFLDLLRSRLNWGPRH